MNLQAVGWLFLAAAVQVPPAVLSPDAAAGKVLFEGRGTCATCHAVNEQGGRRARDLSWIGLLRAPDALRRSVLDRTRHPDVPSLSPSEVEQLVVYLRTLRKMWPLQPAGAGEPPRDIAPASENAAFFDRRERDTEDQPDRLMEALDISKGATVADIGSGTGYFTWRLAERVGPAGKVLAVDVQQKMLDLTRAAVEKRKLRNVDYVLATENDPRLPEGALDLVFIAYAYHEFVDPGKVMAAVRRSLKPGGRVVVLEYAKESNIAPASPLHKMSFEEIRREIEPVGFAIDRLFDFLPVQHGVVFTIK